MKTIILSICLLAYVVQAIIPGKLLQVPINVPQGQLPETWWLKSTSEKEDTWKKENLKLSTVNLYLDKLIDGKPLTKEYRVRIPVADSGHFELSDELNGEYLLTAKHVAYRYPAILINIESGDQPILTVVDENLGVRHLLRRMKNLNIRPLGFEAPYPTPGGLNILGYLKNPIVIMGLLSLFVAYVMPKMVDQEELRQEQGTEQPTFTTPFLESVRSMKTGGKN